MQNISDNTNDAAPVTSTDTSSLGAIMDHSIPFYSLDEVTDIEGLRRYYRRFNKLRHTFPPENVDNYYLEMKLVGIPVQVLYRKGRAVLALTKYTGTTGEDITSCYIHLVNVPERIRASGDIFIRGEIVIHRAEFYAINQQREARGELPFKTMTQCVEDTLRCGDLDVLRRRIVRFYAWELLMNGKDELPHAEQIKTLRNFGFNVPGGQLCTNIEDMMSYINEVARTHDTLPYIIDGIVIKQNDPEFRMAIGVKHNIELAKCVWRFNDDGARVTIRQINWQVDRTGRLIPIAYFPTATINGHLIDHVSLINARWVEVNHLHDGVKLTIDQCGSDTPRIREVLPDVEDAETVKQPETCPCCGSKVITSGNDIFCTNFNCPDLLEESVIYLVEELLRSLILTRSQIHALIESKTITHLIDLFSPLISRTPSVSQETLDRLVSRVREINLLELIMLLGVPNMGKAVASKLASETCSVSRFIQFLTNEKELNFMQFNSLVKEGLRVWIKDPQRLKFLQDISKLHLPYCG